MRSTNLLTYLLTGALRAVRGERVKIMFTMYGGYVAVKWLTLVRFILLR